MSNTQTKTADAVTDFSNDLAALRADIAKISASVMELLQEKTTDKVRNTVDDARQRLSDTAAGAQEKINSMSADLEATIERNPLIAIFLAALAGFLLGLLSRSQK